jgi:hypothetical protein
MRKIKWLVIVICAIGFSTGIVYAEEEISIELTADYYGKYIWRGQNLDDDNVFQPGISVGYGGLTASVWGNMELTNINGNNNQFTEVDYSLDYSGDIPSMEGVGYSVGVIYYDFPSTTVNDTTEVYWGFSFDLPASPSITCYHDLDEAEGTYISLGMGHSIGKVMELCPDVPVGMEIGASLGWGSGSYDKYYWGTDQSKMNDFVFSASFPFEVSDWTVAPSLNYVTLLSDDIRDTDAYGTDSDFFFFGIGISKKF